MLIWFSNVIFGTCIKCTQLLLKRLAHNQIVRLGLCPKAVCHFILQGSVPSVYRRLQSEVVDPSSCYITSTIYPKKNESLLLLTNFIRVVPCYAPFNINDTRTTLLRRYNTRSKLHF